MSKHTAGQGADHLALAMAEQAHLELFRNRVAFQLSTCAPEAYRLGSRKYSLTSAQSARRAQSAGPVSALRRTCSCVSQSGWPDQRKPKGRE